MSFTNVFVRPNRYSYLTLRSGPGGSLKTLYLCSLNWYHIWSLGLAFIWQVPMRSYPSGQWPPKTYCNVCSLLLFLLRISQKMKRKKILPPFEEISHVEVFEPWIKVFSFCCCSPVFPSFSSSYIDPHGRPSVTHISYYKFTHVHPYSIFTIHTKKWIKTLI